MAPLKIPSVISLLAAFAAGAVCHALLWKSPASRPVTTASPAPQVAPASTATPSAAPSASVRHGSQDSEATTASGGRLVLGTGIVDAILATRDEHRLFQRMGLTDENRTHIKLVREQRMAEFKHLEASRARVVSGPDGEFVEIPPFPEEREKWLAGMEEDLRKEIGDDRAAVVARIIAFSDNDEYTGMFRRELIVTPPREAGGKVKIQEKTYDDQGRHVDSDYELIDDGSKSRWGHLLDFESGE